MQENESLQKQIDAEPASIRSSMLTVLRGHTFVSNLNKLINSKQAMRNLEIFSQQNCELKIDALSYRTLHHWDSIGLIECQRESGTGWRKFNVAEALWVYVIIELRNMGVSLNSISKVKSIFFEKIPGLHLKFFEYYLISALYFKTPTFFVISSEGDSAFLSYEEMSGVIEVGLLNHCTLIHLNPLLNQIFKKIEIKSEFQFKRSVTDDQNKICDLMDQEDFDSIKISKAEGKVSNVEIEKGFPRNVPYCEISKNETDAIISTRISKGVVASTKRVKRVKLD